MKHGWVVFIARRYFRARRKERVLTPSIFSVIGIAAGVMTLITVLSVMNGFQTGFIEDILEISSYHLRISLDGADDEETGNLLREVRAGEDIIGALIFNDTQALLRGEYTDYEAANLRSVTANPGKYDPGLLDQLVIQAGTFMLPNIESIVIGSELAKTLGVFLGDTVEVVGLEGEGFSLLTPRSREYVVEGIFKSGYYDFDRNLCFRRLTVGRENGRMPMGTVLGVKLENRFADRRAVEDLKRRLPGIRGAGIESWRSYNSSFFGALRMEKLIMMLLIGLIFIVVGVNIFHGLKRTVVERSDEISLLRSLGAGPRGIRRIFIIDGVLIGLAGGFFGMTAGLAVSKNINSVFAAVERVGNWVLGLVYGLAAPMSAESAGEVQVFSAQYFYMQEVPSTIPFREVFFIVGFALITSAAAAYAASKKIMDINPAEVLRNE